MNVDKVVSYLLKSVAVVDSRSLKTAVTAGIRHKHRFASTQEQILDIPPDIVAEESIRGKDKAVEAVRHNKLEDILLCLFMFSYCVEIVERRNNSHITITFKSLGDNASEQLLLEADITFSGNNSDKFTMFHMETPCAEKCTRKGSVLYFICNIVSYLADICKTILNIKKKKSNNL